MQRCRHGHALRPSQLEHRLHILAVERCLQGHLIWLELIHQRQHAIEDFLQSQFVTFVFTQLNHAKLQQRQLAALRQDYTISHHVGAGVEPENNFFFGWFFLHFAGCQVTHKPDMEIFFLAVIALYVLLILTLCFGWAQAQEHEVVKVVDHHRFLSVVVPFRNEEQNIEALVADLCAQQYPAAAFELIFVNDHSTDRSAEVLTRAISALPNTSFVSLTNTQGKKAALTEGIGLARGEVVVTTDADCRFSAGWLACINRHFQNSSTHAVVGAVKVMEQPNAWPRLQAMEQLSLVAVMAGSSGLGKPVLCNGANFAFLKSTFHEVDGYAGNWHIASGDDEFLMRKILKAHPGSVHFMRDDASVVATHAQPSLHSFLQQRLRWAGKWRYNTSVVAKALAVVVLAVQLCFLSVMIGVLVGWLPASLGLPLLAARFFVETLLLLPVARFLRQPWRWRYFLALQFLYPLYVVAIGFASQRAAAVWKGRRVNTTV